MSPRCCSGKQSGGLKLPARRRVSFCRSPYRALRNSVLPGLARSPKTADYPTMALRLTLVLTRFDGLPYNAALFLDLRCKGMQSQRAETHRCAGLSRGNCVMLDLSEERRIARWTGFPIEIVLPGGTHS